MLNINFNPFPNLETDRLVLRQLNGNDAEAVLKMRGNPETMKFIPRPLHKNIDEIGRAHV